MKKKVAIAVGGTCGHLLPAQAFAEKLQKLDPQIEVLFIGGGANSLKFFNEKKFHYHLIDSAPLLSKNPLKMFKGAKSLFDGFYQSKVFLSTYQPDLVVGFGSYHSVAPLLAAKWMKIPFILHEANSVPGKANRFLGSFAHSVATHFPGTSRYFKVPTFEVPLPLREGYEKGKIEKEHAKSFYSFDPKKKVILVFGGSQGAQAINQVLFDLAPKLKQKGLQLLHFTGNDIWTERLKDRYQQLAMSFVVKTFEPQMKGALSAADYFIGRAGASTIAEAIAFELPGILIPYPFAGGHQVENAKQFAEAIGGGLCLLQSEMTEKSLEHLLDQFTEEKRLEFSHNIYQAKKSRDNLTLESYVRNYLYES